MRPERGKNMRGSIQWFSVVFIAIGRYFFLSGLVVLSRYAVLLVRRCACLCVFVCVTCSALNAHFLPEAENAFLSGYFKNPTPGLQDVNVSSEASQHPFAA